jgi:uncharacterized protein YrrD
MLKTKDVIGKSVLTRDGGEKLGSVKDLVLSRDNALLIGLIVDEGILFGGSRAIPIRHVVSFGRDVVLVTDRGAVRDLERFREARDSMENRDRVLGKRVISDLGEDQGKVNDVYFDERTGRVTGYELVDGGLARTSGGKAFLPAEAVISAGRDAVIVSAPEVAKLSGASVEAMTPGPAAWAAAGEADDLDTGHTQALGEGAAEFAAADADANMDANIDANMEMNRGMGAPAQMDTSVPGPAAGATTGYPSVPARPYQPDDESDLAAQTMESEPDEAAWRAYMPESDPDAPTESNRTMPPAPPPVVSNPPVTRDYEQGDTAR